MKNIFVALSLTAMILAVVFGVFYLRKRDEAKLPGPELVTEPPLAPEVKAETPEPVAAPETPKRAAYPPPELPENLEEGDAHLRQRFTTADPGLRDILERDHLIAKLATATDLIYRKKNPMSQLSFLRLRDRLIVERDKSRLQLSSRNYRRYEQKVALFEKLDNETMVSTYRFLAPLFKVAFNELGMGARDWDSTLQTAYQYLVDLDVPRSKPELVGVGRVFVFVDPALEDLPSTHKAFIRLGPENARRIQDKLRELKKEFDRE